MARSERPCLYPSMACICPGPHGATQVPFDPGDPGHWHTLNGIVDQALAVSELARMLRDIRENALRGTRDRAFGVVFADRIARDFAALRDELLGQIRATAPPMPVETRMDCPCGWTGEGIVLNEAEILAWVAGHGTPSGATIRLRCPRCAATEHGTIEGPVPRG